MKNIALLGSTGSVGKNVLDVARHYPDRFRIRSLSGNGNAALLAEQAKEFRPEVAVIGERKSSPGLKEKIPPGIKVLTGREGLEEIATAEDIDIVFIAISGTAALEPLVAALKAGKTVALASKEPIISAGKIIMGMAKENGGRILPVDSEHSAIMQCLAGRKKEDVRMLYITGSGGSLKDRKKEDFSTLSVEEVLAHPKWDMGRKITVDSATLMNKGLEVIEARWLFDMPPEKIKVIIHPEAIVHSMVEFVDGTINAGLFYPDMRFPILRALAYPDVLVNDFPRVDFSGIGKLSFFEPDTGKFPALDLAFNVLKKGGTMPAALNGANEAAVKSFLGGRIKFDQIIKKVQEVLEKHENIADPSLEEIVDIEKWAYEEVMGSC